MTLIMRAIPAQVVRSLQALRHMCRGCTLGPPAAVAAAAAEADPIAAADDMRVPEAAAAL